MKFSALSSLLTLPHAHLFSRRSELSLSTTRMMSTHVNLVDIELSFGDKPVFDSLKLSLKAREKLFLVGENGIGKSTLLNIIQGQSYDFSGERYISGTIGSLPQSFEAFANRSVVEHFIIESKQPPLLDLWDEKATLPFAGWKDDFHANGGYQLFAHLSQLNLKHISLEQSMSEFSGGEKVKIHLAALATLKPDILLLDEPTNHLDQHGIQWLEKFLKRYSGTLITTTHDRQFIQNVATRIAELSPRTHALVHFSGSYQSYLVERQVMQEQIEQARLAQEKEISTLSSKLSQVTTTHPKNAQRQSSNRDKLSFNARGERRQKSHQRITNQLAHKISTIEQQLIVIPQKPTDIQVDFSTQKSTHDVVIELTNAHKAIGKKCVFSSVNFQLHHNERIVLTGSNGSGKSTFLNMLTGHLSLDKGTLFVAPDVKIGILDQEQQTLDLSLSAFDIIYSHSDVTITRDKAIKHLHNFGIQFAHDIFSPLANLSVGCKRKVQLAQMILQGVNVLLLDEPTNHIDFASLEKIENELLSFQGAIFAISHDRYFIEKIASRVISIDEILHSENKSEHQLNC